MRTIVLAVLASALAGCFLAEEPDVGPLLSDPSTAPDGGVDQPGRCADSDPVGALSYGTHILPLLRRPAGGCAGCHGPAAIAGLNVTSYAALRRGGVLSGTRIIVPGRPCDSVLVDKLNPTPSFGARMPYNGPPYFTREEVLRVSDWIAEGALDN